MIASSSATSSKTALPIIFDTSIDWCFGWFHPAKNFQRGVGVILCRPLGYETNCTYRTYTQLAENLSNAGFDVLRFDYQGTGDSPGNDTDPDRVKAWTGSIASAANELKRRADVTRLALFGVRMGATLAAHTASQIGDVESLVMWAPCVTGRAFTRELRVASFNRFKPEVADSDSDGATSEMEALGCVYTTQTLEDLTALDCRSLQDLPVKRILLIDRDDLPRQGELELLASQYTQMGIDTTHMALPGYCDMMVEPHEGILENTTLGWVANWLSATCLLQDTCLPSINTPTPAPTPLPIGTINGGIRESSIFFGPHHSLFGILAEPNESSASNSRSETAILMLNVGANHRIGPNRIYVKMARSLTACGYSVFRFDLAGIGDSRVETGFSIKNLYERDCTLDVRAAVDYLVANGGKKIVVMGICSGAFVSFQAALVDPRITGQILMNPRLLEYQVGQNEDPLQRAMQSYYKSTHFYRRELLNLGVYRRLWSGEVDVKGIFKRFQIVFKARFKRKIEWFLQSKSSNESVLSKIKRLSNQGTHTLLIMATEDDGRDYIDDQLGTLCCHLQGDPKFQVILVEDADHTFSTSKSQQIVIAKVYEHLEKTTLSSGLTAGSPAEGQILLYPQT